MPEKPTYEELEQRVRELEKAASERIKFEDALRNTQKLFRALYEQAPVGIAVIDSRTGKFLDINDAYCRIIGYSRSRMLEMDFMKITHPDDLQEDLENMGRLRAGEISRFQMEKRYFRKDGSIVWVSLTVVPLWQDRADPMHHIAIVEDITERKRSEEALKASERKFRNIAENMPGMVLKYKLHPDGGNELMYVSKGVEALFEVSPEEAVNNNKLLWDRIHPDDLEAYLESIKASAQNLSPWEREHRIQLPDGRVKWAHNRGIPAKQEDDSVIWDTLVVDITDRKKAEEALRETHAFLQQIIDNSLALIVAKNRKGEYILANDISARLLGLQKDEMIGRTDSDLFPKETADRLTEDDGKVFRTGEFLGVEEQFQIGDRHYVFTTTKFPLFDATGELYAICGIATDITERREMESALRESEERFRAIFEQAAAGIATAMADGRFLETNQALCDMLGYTNEELSEMTVYDITFPEDRQRQIEKDKPVLEGKENTIYLEKRIVHKDGHPVWAQLSSQVIRDEDGSIQYVIGVVVDINERKQAEAELQKSKAMLEATGRMARVGGWELDAETSAVSWTEETYRIHEVPVGHRPPLEEALDFYAPDDRNRLSEAIQRALSQRQPYDLELRFITAKGEPLWVRTICWPTIENEKVTKLLGTFQDVTDRKHAELALKKSEDRHKKISALATDYFYELNVDDERRIFIEWVSDSFERVTTYTRDEMKAFEKWMSKIHPDDLADMQQKTADLLANKSVVNEYRFKNKNGDTRWLVDRLIPEWSEKENRVVKAYGAVRDITARKRTEEALQASLAQKEVLLREIHHRVKNNMQTIVGLLRMHTRRTEDAHLTEIFNDCRDRIGAMSLIHEALYQSDDLSRIDFEAYLKKLCRNLGQAHDARGKGVALTVSAADVSLNMDQGIAVGMIIAELISNAFKHAFSDSESGTVSVHLDRPEGDTVQIVVSDTGKGLPPDFDIQNPSTLGMRLVTGAVTREMGGTIDVEPDNGARFIIRFNSKVRSETKTAAVVNTSEGSAE